MYMVDHLLLQKFENYTLVDSLLSAEFDCLNESKRKSKLIKNIKMNAINKDTQRR